MLQGFEVPSACHDMTCHMCMSSSHQDVAHAHNEPSSRLVRHRADKQWRPSCLWPRPLSSMSTWGLWASKASPARYLPTTTRTQVPRCRCRRPPCLCHRGAPCPVSRTSGPRANCSSVLAQSPPPRLACHRGLFGSATPVPMLALAGRPSPGQSLRVSFTHLIL